MDVSYIVCPVCGAGTITEWHPDWIACRSASDPLSELTSLVSSDSTIISVSVPVRMCLNKECAFAFTDHEGEDIRTKAVEDERRRQASGG